MFSAKVAVVFSGLMSFSSWDNGLMAFSSWTMLSVTEKAFFYPPKMVPTHPHARRLWSLVLTQAQHWQRKLKLRCQQTGIFYLKCLFLCY